jgi:hypothetical protein
MQHGDIQVRMDLNGEPQKLLTYWCGHIGGSVPDSMSVTLMKRRPARFEDRAFSFGTITKGGTQIATQVLNQQLSKLSGDEICGVTFLQDGCHEWMNGRRSALVIDQPMPRYRLNLGLTTDGSIVDQLEKFTDADLIGRVIFGAVYLQGEPRFPNVRWLPPLDDQNTSPLKRELSIFEQLLAEGQAAEIRSLIDRMATIFRKRASRHVVAVRKRLGQLYRTGYEFRWGDWPVTEKDMDEDFEEIMTFLDQQEDDRRKRGRAS